MHSELQDQIPLYAIGELTADEAARLDEHLAVCPSCRALLSEYQFVAGELLEQVPVQTAPERIGVRLANIAAADAKNAQTRSPKNASDSDHKVPFWRGRFTFPRWAAVLALVAILLLVGVSGALAWQLQQRDNIPAQVVQLINDRNLQFVELTTSGASPTNSGFLCTNKENPTGLLWLYGLEPLDHDHVYQVWLRTNGTRDSGGTFRPNYDGRAVALINAPRPIGDYTEIGITIEPVPGSTGPTTPRVVDGKID
jgi:hypothetical protein